MQFDLIVVGGGPAGVTAALRARELGARVALVERQELGGTCTNDGCAPTRVLAKAARLLRDSQKFDEYGLEGERPTLNWDKLLARTQYVVNALHEKKQLLGRLQELGIESIVGAGNAYFVDAHTLAVDDRQLSAEKFILCVGGHARRLNFPGAELAITHSDIWRLKALPRRAAIVGAAATGCQLASVLDTFGARVTLLEVAPRILPVEDELTSRFMAHEFAERGIDVETGIGGVTQLERARDALPLTYQRAGKAITLDVDAVIVAAGWVGNLDTLQLDAAGVQTERGYIKVSDMLQTSAPHIYAAGDVTGRMMLVQSATQEALAAAENALRAEAREVRHAIVPHGGFTDPEYGSVGIIEAQATPRENYAIASVSYAEMDRAVIDDQLAGFCKLIVERETQLIAGAHVVGEQAIEVTQMVAAAMGARARVDDLARLEIAYPTYCAIVGIAARRIVRDLGAAGTDAPWRDLGTAQGAEWERRE